MNKLQRAIDQLDLLDYVERHVGKALSIIDESEVLTFCPFCGEQKGKFYVNFVKKLVYCQRCRYGEGLGIVQFLSDVEGIPKKSIIERLVGQVKNSSNALDEALDLLISGVSVEKSDPLLEKAGAIELPDGCSRLFMGNSGVLMTQAENYLLNRGITREQGRQHEMYFVCKGYFRRRVLVPVRFCKALVAFVARDVTGRAEKKYLNPKGVSQALWFFNWDGCSRQRNIVVCEGVFDALAVERAGYPAMASFGKRLSLVQRKLLGRFEEVTILYDQDALSDAYDSGQRLAELTKVRVGILKKGDPGDSDKATLVRVIESAEGVKSPGFLVDYLKQL